MSRKDFCDLSYRQKRRIMLRENQLLNTCCDSQNVEIYKKLKYISTSNNVLNVNNLNDYNIDQCVIIKFG